MSNRMKMLPEWAPQDAILLAWPHRKTDWAPMLTEVQRTYCDIIDQITRFEPVVLLVPEDTEEYAMISTELRSRCLLITCPTNDTWCRDYGPLSLQSSDGKRGIVDFTFNAWGGKFVSTLDNEVVRRLVSENIFAPDVSYLDNLDLTLEGGALECNGSGLLLTTKQCIEDPLRNPENYQAPLVYKELLKRLGLTDYCSLAVEALPGDDTDGHIDTIVRFVDQDTILYIAPNDPSSQSFDALSQLEKALKELARQYTTLRLIPLPDVGDFSSHYEGGSLIPATYANFLIVNGALLLPTYGRSTDRIAIHTMRHVVPNLEVVPIDCSILLEQHGSLHCISMQIPQGFLNPSLINPIISQHYKQ